VTRFVDRAAAGRALVAPLAALGLRRPLLVGLARGGVPLAVAAAAQLADAEVDVAVARKIGLSGRPEAGLGAVATDGEPVWFARALENQGLTPPDLDEQVTAAREEARRRHIALGAGRRDPAGRDVVLCDDGVATGVTAHAALIALATAGPNRLVLAAPVVAATTIRRLDREWGGEIVAVAVLEDFRAVADHYEDFAQLTDDAVLEMLRRPPGRR